MSMDIDARKPDGRWVEDGTTLNVSNANARAIFAYLGYSNEELKNYVWEFDPAELKGRIATALVVGGVGRDDNGSPDIEFVTPAGATMIDCGRRPGYYAERLAVMDEIADEAIKVGGLVCCA